MANRPSMPSGAPQLATDEDLRAALFADMPIDRWAADAAEAPWPAFAAARKHMEAGRSREAVASWQEVIATPGLESRHYLQAWHFLRGVGVEPGAEDGKQVLGVIVEVAMPEGLDLVAAYPDYSARYFNFSGAGVVWEHSDDSLDAEIDALLEAAAAVVPFIGPWTEARPAPPRHPNARLNFLTPSGLHFGEGPMGALSQDPMAGPILGAAAALMGGLIDRAQQGRAG